MISLAHTAYIKQTVLLMYSAHFLKFTKALLLEVALALLPLWLLDHPIGKLSCIMAGHYHGQNATCRLGKVVTHVVVCRLEKNNDHGTMFKWARCHWLLVPLLFSFSCNSPYFHSVQQYLLL